MDTYQSYHQIKMDQKDVLKVSFAVCVGTYGFQSMSFGLKNAGATYPRMMDANFWKQIGSNMEVYVDDMLAKSIIVSAHVADLQEIFDTTRKYKLKLNPAKYAFGCAIRKILGLHGNSKRNRSKTGKCEGGHGYDSSVQYQGDTKIK